MWARTIWEKNEYHSQGSWVLLLCRKYIDCWCLGKNFLKIIIGYMVQGSKVQSTLWKTNAHIKCHLSINFNRKNTKMLLVKWFNMLKLQNHVNFAVMGLQTVKWKMSGQSLLIRETRHTCLQSITQGLPMKKARQIKTATGRKLQRHDLLCAGSVRLGPCKTKFSKELKQ